MAWTADDLVSAVRVRARIPDGSSAFADAEVLRIADDELVKLCLPLLRRSRGEYGVKQVDVSITAGTGSYRIPAASQFATLREIKLVVASGDEVPLVKVALEDRHAISAGALGYYVIQGDHVILLPTPTVAGQSLRFRFYRRPSRLVVAADAGKVTDASGAPAYVTTALPNAWDTTLAYDLIEGTPNFDWLAVDQTATVATGGGTDLEFAAVPSTEFGVGDYVAIAGETPVVQLPAELHPVLVEATVAACLQAVGDFPGAQFARAALGPALKGAAAMLEPRDEGADETVVNYSSPLRLGRRH